MRGGAAAKLLTADEHLSTHEIGVNRALAKDGRHQECALSGERLSPPRVEPELTRLALLVRPN